MTIKKNNGRSFRDLPSWWDIDDIFLVYSKWNTHTIFCSECASTSNIYIYSRRFYCGKCRIAFTAASRTPLSGSKIKSRIWIKIFRMINKSTYKFDKNLTPYLISKETGISYKSALRCMKIIENNIEFFKVFDHKMVNFLRIKLSLPSKLY